MKKSEPAVKENKKESQSSKEAETAINKDKSVEITQDVENPQSYIFLSIHSGKKKRAPITETHWNQIWIAINQRIAKDCYLPNWDKVSRITGAKWAKEHGLVVCTTENMATLVILKSCTA